MAYLYMRQPAGAPIYVTTSDFASFAHATTTIAGASYPGLFYDRTHGLWLYVGQSFYTSPDLVTWTAHTPPTGFYPQGTQQAPACVFDGSTYLAMDRHHDPQSQIASSPDCSTWTAHTVSGSLRFVYAVASSGARWLVSGFENAGGGSLYASTNGGVSWSSLGTPHGDGSPYLWFGHGVFLAQYNYQVSGTWTPFLCHSTDGVTWTQASTQPAHLQGGGGIGSGNLYISGISWNGSQFVAVGSNRDISGIAYQAVWTSPDGDVWTQRTLPSAVAAGVPNTIPPVWDPAGHWTCIGFDSNNYFAVTSPDGITWSSTALSIDGTATAPQNPISCLCLSIAEATATLSGVGTLTPTAVRKTFATGTLAGAGVLTTAGTVVSGNVWSVGQIAMK